MKIEPTKEQIENIKQLLAERNRIEMQLKMIDLQIELQGEKILRTAGIQNNTKLKIDTNHWAFEAVEEGTDD